MNVHVQNKIINKLNRGFRKNNQRRFPENKCDVRQNKIVVFFKNNSKNLNDNPRKNDSTPKYLFSYIVYSHLMHIFNNFMLYYGIRP